MVALKVLHTKLQQACPFIHQARLFVLLVATNALLIGRCLSLTQLGRSLQTAAHVKHNIKRIDRLLGNAHLYQRAKDYLPINLIRITQQQFTTVKLLPDMLTPANKRDWRPRKRLHGKATSQGCYPIDIHLYLIKQKKVGTNTI